MKIYITEEVGPLLSRMIRKLSCFEKVDIKHAGELLKEDKSQSRLRSIYDYAPTLVITRNHSLVHEVSQFDTQTKIVLMHTHEYDTNEKFWLNAYHLDAFLNSTDKIFEIY